MEHALHFGREPPRDHEERRRGEPVTDQHGPRERRGTHEERRGDEHERQHRHGARPIHEIGGESFTIGKDPANALLQELFVNSCQEEMRALTAVRDSGSQEI